MSAKENYSVLWDLKKPKTSEYASITARNCLDSSFAYRAHRIVRIEIFRFREGESFEGF